MQSPDREGTANPEAVIEPEKILDPGARLGLCKIPPSALREQDVNARSMSTAMFERLSQTIARDKRLESLPLCARTERGLEIISGHHRVRPATAAGLSELFSIVDATGFTRSELAAKQLAHNSIRLKGFAPPRKPVSATNSPVSSVNAHTSFPIRMELLHVGKRTAWGNGRFELAEGIE